MIKIKLLSYSPGEPREGGEVRELIEVDVVPRAGDVVTVPDGREFEVKQILHDYSADPHVVIVELG